MARYVQGKRGWALLGVGLVVLGAVLVSVFAGGEEVGFTATPYAEVVRFAARAPVVTLQVQIHDLSGGKVWDSGVVAGFTADWDRANEWGERLAYGVYLYQAQGWDAQGELVFERIGKLALLPGDRVQLQAAPAIEPSHALDEGHRVDPKQDFIGYEVKASWLTVQGSGDATRPGGWGTMHMTNTSGLNAYYASIGGNTYCTWEFHPGNDVNNAWSFGALPSNQGMDLQIARKVGGLWRSPDLLVDFNTGNVGIGTASPQQELHIHGSFPQLMLTNTCTTDWFTLGTGCAGVSFDDNLGNEPFLIDYDTPDSTLTLDNNGGVLIGSAGNPAGGLEIRRDINDFELVLYESGTTISDHPQMWFDTSGGIDHLVGVNAGTGTFYIYPDKYGDAIDINGPGDWIHLNYDTTVYGNFKATGTKAFVVEDPTNPSKEIHYAALEGPEAGTYARGTAKLIGGEAVIDLPDHFAKVTAAEGLTVVLTPVGKWLQLYVVEKSASQIVVREATGQNGTLDYLVQGIRKGYEDFQVVRDRAGVPMVESLGQGLIQGGPPGTESVVPIKPAEAGKTNAEQ